MRAITKLRRSIRAISPVISVLLMIAIAVAASLVAYAWMMGYIGGTTTKTGKAVLIQSMAADELGNLVVYVQNVGMGAVTVDSVYVGDNLIESGLGIQLLEGETATIPVGYPVTLGDSPKVKVVTTDGTFTESSGTVTSTVNPTTYSITASAGSGGSISPSGSVVVNPGADQTFDITTDTGYHIVDVLVDGGSVGAVSSYTFTNVQADHTISATFAIDTHTITASAGTGGSISPSGSVVVNHGASQGFTITADPNYHILDVLVDGGSVGAVGSYTFTNVVASHTISATFAIDTHTITASAGAGGTISPSGSVVVNHGADQSFTITADLGYRIDDVVVDGGSVGAVGSYTFTNVVADHTISATFAQDTVSVTFAVDPPGSGTTNPSGIQSYTVGQVVPISVSDTNPGDGRVFCYWSATGSITFANAYAASTTATINSAGTITAHFRIPTTIGWYAEPADVDLGEDEEMYGILYRTDYGWMFGGLNGKTINLVFTAPNGTQITKTTTTSTWFFINGIFYYSFTPDAVGTWSVYAQFDGDSTYNASKVGPTTFTVAAVPEYTVSFTQTGAGTAPTVTYHIDSNPDQVGTVPFGVQVTQGHQITYSYQQTVPGATDVQYVLTGTSPSSPRTITGPLTVTGTYKTQYYVTFAVSPVGGGTINRATGWYDSGSLSITATANSGYAFSSWSSDTGSITFANPALATTTATTNGPGTITATFTAATTLFYDPFTTGFDPAWSTGGSPYRLNSNPAPGTSGGYYAVLEGSDGGTDDWMIVTIDTTGYKSISLSYWRRGDSFGSGDHLYIEWHVGTGGGWTQIEDVTSEVWALNTFNFPASAEDTTIQIRFRISGGSGDYGWVDDVLVTGIPLPPRTTIFTDDFGTGFEPEWALTGSVDRDNSNPHSGGGYYARLSGSGTDGEMTLTISTTGYSSIRLSYWRRVDLGSNWPDNFDIEWRIGSGSWNTLESFTGDAGWAQSTFTLSGAEDQATIQIRFRLSNCESGDYAYIDDVTITGIPI